jgi:tetratricopeptide (TPR) repeat protein
MVRGDDRLSVGILAELRRRRVLPVAGAYVAIAWLVTEIASFLLEQAGAPPWSIRLLAIVFIVGFPVAVVLAWTIQVGPDGRRYLDSSAGQAITVAAAVVLGLVAVAGLSWLILPRIDDVADYEPIPNSVAILPLAGDEATPNVRTVGETMLVALKEGLAQSRHVNQVTLTFDQRPADLAAFGRGFRVGSLLVGRISQAAGGLQIDMQLLDVGRDRVSWSQSFQWDSTRIRETGTTIANGVLEAMGFEAISEDEFAGTANREAYDALLEGFELQGGMSSQDQLLAIESFQRAIDLDPQYLQAHVGLAQTIYIYLYSGPPEDEMESWKRRALAAIDNALQLDERSAEAISMAGMWEQNTDLKIQAYRRALDLDPHFGMTYFRLGMLIWEEGDLPEAERLIRKALEYYPLSGNQRGDLAALLWQQGRKEEAAAELNRAIANNPRIPWNYVKLAYIKEDPVERIRLLRKAFELDPGMGETAARISQEYAALGAREETLAWASLATEASPTNPGAWVGSMFALNDLGESELVMNHAERALALDPDNRFAIRELGSIEIAAGNADAALRRWQERYPSIATREVESVDTSNHRLIIDLAVNLVQAGEAEWAHELLGQLLRDNPDGLHSEPFSRVWAYALLGRGDDVLEELRNMDDGSSPIVGEDAWLLRRPEFEFLRDNSDFQAILNRIPTPDRDLALQRLRELERNGELPPAPDADITPSSP